MQNAAILIFLLTYLGVALGEVRGLAVDRTGFALMGALGMLLVGVLDLHGAIAALDIETIILLYSLMIVSAQFRLGGFYESVASSLTLWMNPPRRFLALLMVASAVLSAFLANDIVCLAFTPIVASALLRSGRDPVPYLLGLAVSSNLGSAVTLIGNPQNMLIGQVAHLDFMGYSRWAIAPSVLSLVAAYQVIVIRFRFKDLRSIPAAVHEPLSSPVAQWPSIKGAIVLIVMVSLFFTELPRPLVALGAACFLLCSRRMTTRSLLGLVDWHLITLFIGLFIVVAGIEAVGVPERLLGWLRTAGLDPMNPFALLGISALLSNLVSNVPAVMLLVKFLPDDSPSLGYVLAVCSTFAGNLVTIGSLANLIMIEQASRAGVKIGFLDYARVGVPVTILSFVILAGWIALTLG